MRVQHVYVVNRQRFRAVLLPPNFVARLPHLLPGGA